MRKKLLNTKLWLITMMLALFSSGAWGQANESANHTGNITLSTSRGTNVTSSKVVISGTQYNAMKMGTGSGGGTLNISVPAGTKYLHLHIAAWSGESPSVSISTSPSVTTSPTSISPTADGGISGTGTTFTLNTPANATTSYYKVITFSSPLESAVTLSLSTSAKKKRFLVWGVTSEDDPSKVSTPIFGVTAGTYNEAKSVTLSCATAGASIYYTTDGSTPTTSSTAYSGAIAVDVTTTIKAKAFKDGLDDSDLASATYTLKCATPTITKADGVFVSSKEITMTSSTGASIYYTSDGSTTPTTSSTAYNDAAKPVISATTTFKAIAVKDGWSDSDVQSTTITKETVLDGLSALVAKTNTSDQSYYVELSDAQVTYVNGKNGYMEDSSKGIYIYNISPTLNKVYNGIFRVTYQLYNSMPELKAITAIEGEITDGDTKAPTEMTASALSDAFAANLGRQIQITGHTTSTTTVLVTGIDFYTTYYNPSFEKDHTYTIIGYPYNNNGTLQFRVISAVEKPDAPTFVPASGEFATDFTLTISATTGSTVYYTTNGDTPTASSTEYDPDNKPTISAGADVTVKAIAVLAGMTSAVGSATYEYKAVSKPTFSPADGSTLYYGETVGIESDVDGTIYYTTDGTTPTTSSSTYSDTPIAITANTVTIKAFVKNSDGESSVASATFTLKTPDAPTAVPGAGAVEAGTNIALNSRAGTTIYYTLDESTPDNTSTTYSGAITIDAAKTIKAIAYDGAGNKSSVLTAAYTIIKVATPTFGTATSSFPISQEVSINCNTDGATIYYTTDGSTPTTSSSEYSAPFKVTATTTVKAIAVKANCTNSDVASVTYTKATVYTVAEVKNGTASGNNVYVKGYIVGSYNATAPQTGGNAVSTNLALADSYEETNGANTIPVELPSSNNYRTDWGPSNNQHYIGVAQIIVKANCQTYFSVNGLKAPSSFIKTAEVIKVTAAGYATWASNSPLDFTGKNIEAYIATAKGDGTSVNYTQIYKVPANTGVLLHYTGGKTEEIPTFDGTDADDVDGNLFQVGTGSAVASVDGDLHNYILNNGSKGIGFYRAAGQTVAKNRAYLQIDESTSDVRGFIYLPGTDLVGIQNVEINTEKDVFFNLSGQRVTKPTRGLYIVNGKKVMIK